MGFVPKGLRENSKNVSFGGRKTRGGVFSVGKRKGEKKYLGLPGANLWGIMGGPQKKPPGGEVQRKFQKIEGGENFGEKFDKILVKNQTGEKKGEPLKPNLLTQSRQI